MTKALTLALTNMALIGWLGRAWAKARRYGLLGTRTNILFGAAGLGVPLAIFLNWVTERQAVVQAGLDSSIWIISTVVIAQIALAMAVTDTLSLKLPRALSTLLYLELLGALVLRADPNNWMPEALVGAVIWFVPLLPGVALGMIGLGDLLLAPAFGGWLGAWRNEIAAMIGIASAFLAAAAWGQHGREKVPLAPFLYGGWVFGALVA